MQAKAHSASSLALLLMAAPGRSKLLKPQELRKKEVPVLVIRDEQWKAFEGDAAKQFEDQLVTAMLASWPEVCAPLGRSGSRARVQAALEKAKGHGFEENAEISRFVHLAFCAGEEFDTATGWGPNILGWEVSNREKLSALEIASGEA